EDGIRDFHVTGVQTCARPIFNTVWWLRPSPVVDEKDGKVSNRRVLKPYRQAQQHLMKSGYTPKLRPSEHDISDKFGKNNGGAIQIGRASCRERVRARQLDGGE